MKKREECHCECHRNPNTRHFMPCCDGIEYDWNSADCPCACHKDPKDRSYCECCLFTTYKVIQKND